MNFFNLSAAITAALLLTASPAVASVQIRIFESGSDVIAEAIGSINLPPTSGGSHCGGAPGVLANGAISPALGAICVGSGAGFTYSLDGGPTNFGGGMGRSADESWGNLFGINGGLGLLATTVSQVDSQSIWRNTTLADLGLQPGPIGTWTLNQGTISATATPAPFGLLGLGAMWAWARRLRRRIREAQR